MFLTSTKMSYILSVLILPHINFTAFSKTAGKCQVFFFSFTSWKCHIQTTSEERKSLYCESRFELKHSPGFSTKCFVYQELE